MKKLFILLFLFISVFSYSQKTLGPVVGNPNLIYHYSDAIGADSVLLINVYPNDTPSVSMQKYQIGGKEWTLIYFSKSLNTFRGWNPVSKQYQSLSSGGSGSSSGNPDSLHSQLWSYYLNRTNHTGTQLASTISDFTTTSQTIGDARYPQLSGSYSNPTWITGLAWSKISSTPTTLSGYGITDGVSLTGTQTLTNKTLTSPKLNSSSTVGYVWTATNTSGSGNWQAAPSGGTINWGDIGGDMSNQPDLIDSLNKKVDKDSTFELTTDTHLSTAIIGSDLKISLDNIDGLQKTPKFRGQEYYKYSGWSNLNDFTDNTMSATVSGGNIVIPDANVSDFTKYLTLDSINCTNHWKMIMLFKRTANPAGGGSGISLGMQSINTDAICSNAVYFAGAGTLQYFYNNNGGGWSTGIGGTSSALTYSNGDTIRLVIQRDNQHVSVVAENLSNPAATARQIDLDIDITSGPILPNTARWTIFAQGGTFNVISLRCINNEVQTSNVLVIGDSKTMGFGATNYDSTVTGQLKKWYNGVSVSGGFGDKISDMLLRLPELLSIHAKVVVLNSLGSNDIRFGRSVSATMADYATLRQAFIDDGSTVIDVSPCYESAQDLTALYTSWKSTYGANPNSVDIFNLPHQYGLSGDGIHDTDDTQKAWMKRLWDLNVFEGAKN